MHDLRFREATNIRSWRHLTQRRYGFFICDQVQEAYQNNLLRAHGLLSIPGFTFMNGERWAKAVARARLTRPNVSEDSEEFAWIAKGFFDDVSNYTEKQFLDHRNEATSNAERTARRVPPIHDAYDQLLQSAVINAWMAFEVLCDDLWHKVVTIRPNYFAAMSGVEKKDLGFRSRKKIRNSYAALFKIDGADIKDSIAKTAIDALASMRNLLVHSAGRIDAFFEKDSQNIPEIAHLRTFAIGDLVKFDGLFVRSLVDPVTPCGYALLYAVDNWLSRHH